MAEQDYVTFKIESSLGGLEPPTFRLTAERANRLRHRDNAAHWAPKSQAQARIHICM